MKKNIHPKYYPNAKVVCACGNTFETGSTKEMIRTDVCSACHPFFTGEMRIVDTAGQVERFFKRLERRDEIISVEEQEAAGQKPKGKKKVVYELVDEKEEEAVKSPEEAES